MRDASMFLDAIALHYYTRVGDKVIIEYLPDGNERYLRDNSKSRKSATDFDEDQWFGVMKAAAFTDELVSKHIAIMDQYDPEKKVALIVDEWGTWFDNEPGTNPGFLYQQNTLRDAVSAGISLNIFNNHADRIHMTNIAQTINVLQAMVLTEGEKMILTPTYHIYDMYKVHQDAKLLDFAVLSDDYGKSEADQCLCFQGFTGQHQCHPGQPGSKPDGGGDMPYRGLWNDLKGERNRPHIRGHEHHEYL